MFRAEIRWARQGPILKMEGKLVRDWAEQARSLVTDDVVPKELVVDITEVSYVDYIGEEFLLWLASRGAKFLGGNVYVAEICNRLQLPMASNRRSRHKRRLEAAVENAPIAP